MSTCLLPSPDPFQNELNPTQLLEEERSDPSDEDEKTGFGRTSSWNLFETDVDDVFETRKPDRFRLQYLSKLETKKVWVPQAERPPKHQTVIIFDWDDTLLCTTFLNSVQGRAIPPATQRHLQSIERSAYQLLETALTLGHTFIITNAMEGWVEDSAERFSPSLLPILDKVRIISARSTQEANCDGDVSQWKVKAFLEMGRQLHSEVVTNLISIGDSNFEHDAAHVLGQQFSHGLIKTVKLQERPSPQEQTKELDLLAPKLKTIVEKACNLKVRLERKC
jgi:hypothetical protein